MRIEESKIQSGSRSTSICVACGVPIIKLGRPGGASKIRYPIPHNLPHVHLIDVHTLSTLVILYKDLSVICIYHD
jgi:hypothetical protein